MKENVMNFKHILPRLSVLAAAAVLAACSTLPAEAPPVMDLPPTFAQGQGLEPGVLAQPNWWTVLGDPTLDELVVQGLAANLDLQQAAERVQRSRALAAGRRAELAPSGGVGVGGLAQQLGRVEAPGLDGDARRSEIVSAGLNFSWEIDLFGRLRQQVNAAGARSDAVAADAEALRLAVGAEIAQVWFALNGAREQLRLTHAVVENRRATLSLVLRRVSAGYDAPLDEARARAELSAAESELPAQDAALAVATHRLAVLLGVSPSGFQAPKPPDGAPRSVALHLPAPASWMALRPDLKSAEAQLRAQALDVAAIRAEFMPRLSVSGVLGFVAGSLSGLGAAGSASWFLAPSLSVPVFDFGRIDARLQAAQAGQREALLSYRQHVLLATEEVESALVLVRQGQVRLAALQDRARHAVTAEGLARKRFEAGGSDLLELLDAQRGAQQAELGLSAALTAQRQQVVALQRALGARFLPETGASQGPRLATAPQAARL
jgi:NodT family efflux transporter outer membrane factor (OMF) lipoprotein